MKTIDEEPTVAYLPDIFRTAPSSGPFIHFYSSNQDSLRNKVHLRQCLICLLINGQKQVHLSSGHTTIDSSRLLLIGEGNTLMSERIANGNRYESLLLFFPRQEFNELLELLPPTENTTSQSEQPLVALSQDSFIKHFIQSLLLLREAGIDRHPSLMQAKTRELLHYLCVTYPDQLKHFIRQQILQQDDNQFRQIIAANTGNPLSVEELSFLCNMSVSTFKRRFTEIYGTTPKKYMTEHRMLQARNLLINRKKPSEIYFELGYEHLSGFSNEFKKHFGVSPKTFQEQL